MPRSPVLFLYSPLRAEYNVLRRRLGYNAMMIIHSVLIRSPIIQTSSVTRAEGTTVTTFFQFQTSSRRGATNHFTVHRFFRKLLPGHSRLPFVGHVGVTKMSASIYFCRGVDPTTTTDDTNAYTVSRRGVRVVLRRTSANVISTHPIHVPRVGRPTRGYSMYH